ncbi:MAG: Dihydropteroate synthase [Elusimicrobia bacterium]|nr:Dihydropteroate synthase [Elusimicrobiota bacterium]
MLTTSLAGIKVGKNHPPRIMGIINLSPESFFKGSVPLSKRALMDKAKEMEDDGADFIDVGAMSTAPYLSTQISEEEEERRLVWGLEAIQRSTQIPLSIDTFRARPAKAGLEAGASLLNVITGLEAQSDLLPLLKKFKGLILMAHPKGFKKKGPPQPIPAVKAILRQSIDIAERTGVSPSRMVVDPGIGFFRNFGMLWWKWDLKILRNLDQLNSLRLPVLVGVSRKSFIGEILNLKNPEDRLNGSLAATALAVMKGASILRTHDVKETRECVRLAEKLL